MRLLLRGFLVPFSTSQSSTPALSPPEVAKVLPSGEKPKYVGTGTSQVRCFPVVRSQSFIVLSREDVTSSFPLGENAMAMVSLCSPRPNALFPVEPSHSSIVPFSRHPATSLQSGLIATCCILSLSNCSSCATASG